MNTQSFIAAARTARRALLGRRARSNVTGREGRVTDGNISLHRLGKGYSINHTLTFTTDVGIEYLTIQLITFLDEGVSGEPPALTDGKTKP